MKFTAYIFGLIGFCAIFILSAFEKIMMSVNTYGTSTLICLYLFFATNIFCLLVLFITYLNDKKYANLSFNLNNKGIAYLYLIMSVISMLLLIASNDYTLNTNNFLILTKGFFESPELFIPVLLTFISGLLFVINDYSFFQKQPEKKIRVSHC